MVKDTKSQILLLIIIFIISVLIGIGLFAFLRYAKNIDKKYNLKDRTIKLNSNLDGIEKEYSKYKDCKIDLSKVNVDEIGKYEYSIKCKKKSSKAYIYVK